MSSLRQSLIATQKISAAVGLAASIVVTGTVNADPAVNRAGVTTTSALTASVNPNWQRATPRPRDFTRPGALLGGYWIWPRTQILT